MFASRFAVRSLSLSRGFSVTRVSRKARKTKGVVALGYDFDEKAKTCLTGIDKALQPLVPLNEDFRIDRNVENELTVHTGRKGSYVFRIDSQNQQIFLMSPMSGNYHYTYNEEEELWLGTHDQHDMRGLITRDFIRHCVGLPLFD